MEDGITPFIKLIFVKNYYDARRNEERKKGDSHIFSLDLRKTAQNLIEHGFAIKDENYKKPVLDYINYYHDSRGIDSEVSDEIDRDLRDKIYNGLGYNIFNTMDIVGVIKAELEEQIKENKV